MSRCQRNVSSTNWSIRCRRPSSDHTGAAPEAYEPKVKPQLSPLMTSYPSTLAAYAAIGHTAFLEFEARVPEKILFTHLAKYLENPAEHDDLRVDPDSYREMAKIVTETGPGAAACWRTSPAIPSWHRWRSTVCSRPPSRTPNSGQSAEILRAVILYGDILPDWQDQELHPMTRIMLGDLTRKCNPFFDQLPHTPSHRLAHLGIDWVKALCLCLAPYLPEPESRGPGTGVCPGGGGGRNLSL